MPRERAAVVRDKTVVALRVRLTDEDDGLLMEATVDEPLVYLHGAGQVLPRLEEALLDREVGEEVEITLGSDEGFGVPTVDAERVIPRHLFTADSALVAGAQIQLDEGDEPRPAWVLEAIGPHLRVSLSHPLASSKSTFEAEVLKVREASPAELEQGFATSIEEPRV